MKNWKVGAFMAGESLMLRLLELFGFLKCMCVLHD